MRKAFQRGLVVGKFSPLHRGHELVIRHALGACTEVILITYSKPEMPGCDAARRERWLAELFPQARRLVVTDERLRHWTRRDGAPREIPPNDAHDTIHRRFVGFLCRHVLHTTVDAVFTSEDYGDGFAAELTRYYRGHDPMIPPVAHVSVDRRRRRVPVSGSRIRANVEAGREWLSPTVYASFVRRICFLGGESSGKSTLGEALAQLFNTAFVPEFGRELWETRGGALTCDDMRLIARRQVAMEEAAARQAKQFLFCDTSPLTTLFYSLHMFGRAAGEVERLAARPYDLVVLCAPDFPFVQDGTRQDATFRARQHGWYLDQLAMRGIPFLVATGPLMARIEQIRQALVSLRSGNPDRLHPGAFFSKADPLPLPANPAGGA